MAKETIIEEVMIDSLTLHDVALSTPKMNDEQYSALKQDIEMNGQIDPAIVYRGKIVDGRHRWLILQELGIKVILITRLPNNTTLAKLKSLVRSKETRRHESAAQLAISAYKYMQDSKENISQADAAEMFGANRKRISEAKKIAEFYKRPDILDTIFNGNKVNTGTSNIPFWTDSLATIVKWLAEVSKLDNEPKVKARTEITEDEQKIVNEYFNAIVKEADIVIEELVTMLYFHTKGE